MAAAVQSGNCDRVHSEIAPYSQQLGDFFTGLMSVLVKTPWPIYSARLGMADLPGAKSRESQFYSPPAAPVARSQQAAGVLQDFRELLRNPCAGEGIWRPL